MKRNRWMRLAVAFVIALATALISSVVTWLTVGVFTLTDPITMVFLNLLPYIVFAFLILEQTEPRKQ